MAKALRRRLDSHLHPAFRWPVDRIARRAVGGAYGYIESAFDIEGLGLYKTDTNTPNEESFVRSRGPGSLQTAS